MNNPTFSESVVDLREELSNLININHEKYLFCYHDHYKDLTYSVWDKIQSNTTSGLFQIRDNVVIIKENGLLSNLERKEIQEILKTKVHNYDKTNNRM